jgi:hypothetical protein
MERPDLALTSPDAGSEKCYSPAKGTIKSQLSLTGQSSLDPMRGRFVDETDPRAKVILENQKNQIEQIKRNGRHVPVSHIQKHLFEPGHAVIHASRGRGVVAKFSEDGKRQEVIFAGGARALVKIEKLTKAKY